MRLLGIIFFSFIWVSISFAQQQKFSEAIEDNSFFIEEAYNQEERVVQHIFTLFKQNPGSNYIYSFTQEWPAGGQINQLSYTIPYQSLDIGAKGLGDIMLNYRYQLTYDDNFGWIAPRLSLILPTGNKDKGLGNGVVGFQINVPLSKRWTDQFITHFNAGCTILPNVESELENGNKIKKTLPSYFAGVSGIWLLNENFNFMCELLYSYNSDFTDAGNVEYTSQTILSPGVRYAINLGNLQIVPGLAMPISFDASGTNVNIFGYLSFEHPF